MKIIHAMTLVCFLAACEERDALDVHYGFDIVRVYGDAHSLIDPDGRVIILPNVTEVKDDKRYIIGYRAPSEPEFSVNNKSADQPFGYFLYDKKSGELSSGLSQGELNELLNEKIIDIRLKEAL